MTTPEKIHQFIPDPNGGHIHGAYGWGIDIGELRVVMYAPMNMWIPNTGQHMFMSSTRVTEGKAGLS